MKGIGPTILSGAPYTGIQMTCYELLQRNAPDAKNSLLWQLVNGATAGLIAQTREFLRAGTPEIVRRHPFSAVGHPEFA